MKDPHTLLLKITRILELVLAAAILVVIVVGAVMLFYQTAADLTAVPESFSVGDFLSGALLLVMGLEFVKMLALHTAASVIDVLLFTIARQMIVTHGSSLDTLLGVGAVAGIFAIRKFLHPGEEDGAQH